eukprot:4821771-Amphidinium_carterae.1
MTCFGNPGVPGVPGVPEVPGVPGVLGVLGVPSVHGPGVPRLSLDPYAMTSHQWWEPNRLRRRDHVIETSVTHPIPSYSFNLR